MRYLPIVCIVITYLILGTAYAPRTPDWQSPDEPAHYNYVRQLADGIAPFFPVMAAGDYNEAYQNDVRDSCFAPAYSIEPYQYEDYQPPLYYLLLAPAFALANGQLEAVRLVSVVMGAGIVILAYLIARQILSSKRTAVGAQNFAPLHHWEATAVAAFVAFVPQHLSILGSVNNDALAGLLVAAMVYLLVANDGWRLMSLLLGLAFLTKVTAYLMAGVIGLVLLYECWGNWERLVKRGIQIFVPALLIGALWWGRNVLVYPGFDWLGTQAHDAVVQGQLTTADYISKYSLSELLTRFRVTTFRSFFGQFGWMAAPFPAWMYVPLLMMASVSVFGAVWRVARGGWRVRPILILGSLLGLNMLLYVVYNLQFVQHQGRYLFPSIIPIAVAIVVGLKTVLGERLGRLIIPPAIILGLLYLNYVALRFILPGLHWSNC